MSNETSALGRQAPDGGDRQCGHCLNGRLMFDDGEWACVQCGSRPVSEFEAAQTSRYLEARESGTKRRPRHEGVRLGADWAS